MYCKAEARFTVDSFAARWIENTWRLAGVLHVARHLDSAHTVPLAYRDTAWAIQLMNYFIRQQLEIIHESRQKAFTDKLGRIMEKLSRKGGSCSLGDFKNDGWDTEQVLAVARMKPDRIEVIATGGDKKGRPGYRLRLIGFGERANKGKQEPEEDEISI